MVTKWLNRKIIPTVCLINCKVSTCSTVFIVACVAEDYCFPEKWTHADSGYQALIIILHSSQLLRLSNESNKCAWCYCLTLTCMADKYCGQARICDRIPLPRQPYHPYHLIMRPRTAEASAGPLQKGRWNVLVSLGCFQFTLGGNWPVTCHLIMAVGLVALRKLSL